MPLSSSSRTSSLRLICGSVVNTIETSARPELSTSWRWSIATGTNFLNFSP